MRPTIDFWFDFSCPFAYLGSRRVEAMASRVGANLTWQPMLLGGVFRARRVAQNLAGSVSAQKARHNADDMRRLAALWDLPLNIPGNHPQRTVEALRALLVVGEPFAPLAHAFYSAYWIDGVDLTTADGVASVLTEAGHDAAAVLEEASTPAIKDELRARTERAIAAGVFGAPAMVVDGVLYWGADRLEEIEAVLGGVVKPIEAVSSPCSVDVYFDYADGFSRVAFHRARILLGDAARWRPIDGVALAAASPSGTAVNDAKSAFLDADLRRQFSQAGLQTMWRRVADIDGRAALAATAAAGAPPALIAKLFDAAWRDDRDIADETVLAELAPGVTVDDGALTAATEAALGVGVFGTPTFVVNPPGAEPALYWGSDRLDLAVRAAGGDPTVF